mgnify:CR=1 FL=1
MNNETLPWNIGPLKDWDIGAMNHYYALQQRHLFVMMTKGNRFIKAEGSNERDVWRSLSEQAVKEAAGCLTSR